MPGAALPRDSLASCRRLARRAARLLLKNKRPHLFTRKLATHIASPPPHPAPLPSHPSARPDACAARSPASAFRAPRVVAARPLSPRTSATSLLASRCCCDPSPRPTPPPPPPPPPPGARPLASWREEALQRFQRFQPNLAGHPQRRFLSRRRGRALRPLPLPRRTRRAPPGGARGDGAREESARGGGERTRIPLAGDRASPATPLKSGDSPHKSKSQERPQASPSAARMPTYTLCTPTNTTKILTTVNKSAWRRPRAAAATTALQLTARRRLRVAMERVVPARRHRGADPRVGGAAPPPPRARGTDASAAWGRGCSRSSSRW